MEASNLFRVLPVQCPAFTAVEETGENDSLVNLDLCDEIDVLWVIRPVRRRPRPWLALADARRVLLSGSLMSIHLQSL